MKTKLTANVRSGFTVIELTIGATMLLVLSAIIVESTDSMKRMVLTSGTQSQLQEQARRAMSSMLGDLRLSGFVEADGLDYPYFFDGVPDPAYAADAHAHAQANKAASDGDLDFGVNREILFLMPADLDGDGAPDIDPATGRLVWNVDQPVSYTVVTSLDGRNSLVRTQTDGQQRIVARDVERFYVEDWTVNALLPPATVRLELYFRKTNKDGHEFKYRVESWVGLRNGINL